MNLYVKLNWDAKCFPPVESKDCINSENREKVWFEKDVDYLEEARNLFPLQYRLSAENLSHKKQEKFVHKKLKNHNDVIFLRVLLHKICFFLTQYQIFVSAVTDFETYVIRAKPKMNILLTLYHFLTHGIV